MGGDTRAGCRCEHLKFFQSLINRKFQPACACLPAQTGADRLATTVVSEEDFYVIIDDDVGDIIYFWFVGGELVECADLSNPQRRRVG